LDLREAGSAIVIGSEGGSSVTIEVVSGTGTAAGGEFAGERMAGVLDG
jgi:hypothetical protein